MEKRFYVENNRIKIIRFVVSYDERIETETLIKTSSIKQLLNTDADLEELLNRLKTKLIVPLVENLDTSDINIFEGRYVESYEEADKLINPDLETVKKLKIEEIEKTFDTMLGNGIQLEIQSRTYNVSCKSSDILYYNSMLQADMQSYELILDNEMVTLTKEEFKKLHTESNNFFTEKYAQQNQLIFKCKKATTIDEVKNISI